ncbi:MBL fold metallo-hydrolase [Clostridium sp.]|uniref:MBL fold metallo-hydrolase n=1 Tax=Clostridium sp. TaxID=1506 RepID=UPI002631533D|nr:MBL fold metallo-hydrolase [Clostridium sp.]
MKIQLIRHATLIVTLNNKRILIDPLLSEAGSMDPVPDVPNQNYNPLVKLPLDINLIINCDAIIVTHTHRDHFDEAAASILPKSIPIFCQPEDEVKLQSYGFTEVHPIHTNYVWNEISINRTRGKHGHDELAEKMAPVSGFVISFSNEPSVYITGDTVWCEEVQEAIEKFKPNVVVCNCGSAQFGYGQPITMNSEDLYKLCHRYTNIEIVAVHMEAWNHCRLLRKDLKSFIESNNINNNIFILNDGEILNF